MINLLLGHKGSGKTKKLIDLTHAAVESSKGNVVCIEKGNKLTYDINYQCRLIDTDMYSVIDFESLYGFIAGILASNHDVTDLFLDGTLKICKYDYEAFEKLVVALDQLVEKIGLNMTMTVSMPEEKVTDTIRKFI